jgi:hypothetical protein
MVSVNTRAFLRAYTRPLGARHNAHDYAHDFALHARNHRALLGLISGAYLRNVDRAGKGDAHRVVVGAASRPRDRAPHRVSIGPISHGFTAHCNALPLAPHNARYSARYEAR